MVYPVRIYDITIKPYLFLRLCEFNIFNFKRQLRCNNTQRADYSLNSLRTNNSKWFCSLSISHAQQKTRQTTYMISMIMCKTYYIYRLRAYPGLFHGDV